MALKDKINDDLKTALLGGNRFRGEVLRSLKAAILNEEVTRNMRDSGIDDSSIEQVIAREVKKRNESAVIYDGADRSELAENERAEAFIMSEYLPAQLSEEEILKVVEQKIKDLGVSGPSAMGQVIGAVKQELGNSANGALIAQLVKKSLQ